MPKNSGVADIFQLDDEADEAFSDELITGTEPYPDLSGRQPESKPSPSNTDQTTPRETSQTEEVNQDIATGGNTSTSNTGGGGQDQSPLTPAQAREKIRQGESVDPSRIDGSAPDNIGQSDINKTIQLGLDEGDLKRVSGAEDKPAEELTERDIEVNVEDMLGDMDTGTNKGGGAGTDTAGGGAGSGADSSTDTDTDGGDSIFDMFGIDQDSEGGNVPDDLSDLYNFDQPNQDTGGDSQRRQRAEEITGDALDRSDQMDRIDQMMEDQFTAIESKFERKRKRAKETSENQRKSQISNLASVGVVNPVSSGVASIGTASKESLNRRLDALDRAEQAAKAKARKAAMGLKTDQEEQQLKAAQAELERINQEEQDRIDRQQQKFENKIDLVNSALSAWKAGKKLDNQEKEAAKESIFDLVENFGSAALEGMDEKELNNLANAAGFTPNALKSGIKNLKKKELQNEELNMRKVGGSLYNISKDEDGNPVAELLIEDPDNEAGGSDSSSYSGNGEFTTNPELPFDEWLQQQTEDDFLEMGFAMGPTKQGAGFSPDPSDPEMMQHLKDEYEKEVGYGNIASLSEDFFDRADELRTDLDQGRISQEAAQRQLSTEYPEAAAPVIEDQLTPVEQEGSEEEEDPFDSQKERTQVIDTGKSQVDKLFTTKADQGMAEDQIKSDIKAQITETAAKRGWPDRIEGAIIDYVDTKRIQ